MSRRIADYLNTLSADVADAELARCCASRAWVEGMVAARPFVSDVTVFETADQIWRSLAPDDWREAFGAHPRIGERTQHKWAQEEQSGTAGASRVTRSEFADGNRNYEKRFGHVFLICATGLSAETLLSELRRRLPNEPARELEIAAAEQAKITRLRLEKLVNS